MKLLKKILNISLSLIGLTIIFFMVKEFGFNNLYNKINQFGWKILILLFMPIYWFFMHAIGTHFTLNGKNRKNIGIFRLTILQTISYGISWSQPLQGIVGEPVKMLFLNEKKHDRKDFAASLLIDNTINLLSNLIIVIIAIMSVAFVIETSLIIRLALYSIIVSIFILFIIFIKIQKKGIFSIILLLMNKMKIFNNFIEKKSEKFKTIDLKIKSFYINRKKDFYLSLIFHLLERLYGIFEFFLIFNILGKELNIISCLFIYGIINTLDNLLFIIQIGGMEAYTSLLLKSMGLTIENINIAVPLFRRIRILFWIIISFIMLLPVKLIFKKGQSHKQDS